MREFETAPQEPAGDRAVVTLLGLALLLLGFFILLGSVSLFDRAKARSAIESLNATFAPARAAFDDLTWNESADARFVSPAALPERIAEAVRSAVPDSRMESVEPERLFRLRLSTPALFAGASARLSEGGERLLDGLAALLARNPPGLRYELEVELGRGSAAQDPAPQALAFARAAGIGAWVSGRGAPPGAVAAGLGPGPADEAQILFHIRDQREPRIDFRRSAD